MKNNTTLLNKMKAINETNSANERPTSRSYHDMLADMAGEQFRKEEEYHADLAE